MNALAKATSLFLALAACGGAQTAQPHWGYDGANGPEHWAELDRDLAICKSGARQSPIDLSLDLPADPSAVLSFAYAPVALHARNNGHTVQVRSDGASSVTFAGVRYTLKQFHFHSPAEHTLAGRAFDLEMHLVHASDDGALLVIGVLFARGKPNALLAPAFDAIPASEADGERSVPGVAIDLHGFVEPARFARYDGSLTTPPCSEGVKWFVSLDSAEVSDDQIARFRAATHGASSRPIQPTNGRPITGATAR
ncbi:MAG TPA: carbonic anhydrase family protein [Labilithrix sp.]